MNLNNSNFLHQINGDIVIDQQQLNDLNHLLTHDESEVFEIESNSTSASISEFLQPKNYNQPMPYTSSPKKDKELNLSDYFKSLQM